EVRLWMCLFKHGGRFWVPGHRHDLCAGRIERLDDDTPYTAASSENDDFLLRQLLHDVSLLLMTVQFSRSNHSMKNSSAPSVAYRAKRKSRMFATLSPSHCSIMKYASLP